MIKTIGWREDHPRLWGAAAGLVACHQAGVRLWFAPDTRLLCAGSATVAAVMKRNGVPGLQAMDLGALYREAWRKPVQNQFVED